MNESKRAHHQHPLQKVTRAKLGKIKRSKPLLHSVNKDPLSMQFIWICGSDYFQYNFQRFCLLQIWMLILCNVFVKVFVLVPEMLHYISCPCKVFSSSFCFCIFKAWKHSNSVAATSIWLKVASICGQRPFVDLIWKSNSQSLIFSLDYGKAVK